MIGAISTPERAFRNHILKLMPNFKPDCLEMRKLKRLKEANLTSLRKTHVLEEEEVFSVSTFGHRAARAERLSFLSRF